MARLRLGVDLTTWGMNFRESLAGASRLGAAGVVVEAISPLAPGELSQTGRREVRHLLRSHNLELITLRCSLRHPLGTLEGQDARIQHVLHVLSLSYDLGARSAIVQAGSVAEEPGTGTANRLREALLAIGQHGDRTGTVLALETGLESGKVLAEYLAAMDTGGLAAGYDPSNLLVHGFDPYESLRALAGRVAHFQAKDARRASTSQSAREVPLGHGDIDWIQMIGLMEEIDFLGWVFVRRESGESPTLDTAAGLKFLRQLTGAV